MLIEEHLHTGATLVAGSQRKPAIEEMRTVLQLALGRGMGERSSTSGNIE
jgi:hypothetical protein